MFAQIVFHELGVSYVQFKIQPVKTGYNHQPSNLADATFWCENAKNTTLRTH